MIEISSRMWETDRKHHADQTHQSEWRHPITHTIKLLKSANDNRRVCLYFVLMRVWISFWTCCVSVTWSIWIYNGRLKLIIVMVCVFNLSSILNTKPLWVSSDDVSLIWSETHLHHSSWPVTCPADAVWCTLYLVLYIYIYIYVMLSAVLSVVVVLQQRSVGQAKVTHAVVVIFMEFFAWGLLTTPMLTVSIKHTNLNTDVWLMENDQKWISSAAHGRNKGTYA